MLARSSGLTVLRNTTHGVAHRNSPSRLHFSRALTTMNALIYNGPGAGTSLTTRPKPAPKSPTDAIVKLTHSTICGTDLHIIKGDVPTCAPGTILGHEGVGTIEEIGSSVSSFKKGDPVLISCISACGTCASCRRGMPSHCASGGWILGNTIDGTQAEYVRIPHADASLYAIPPGVPPASMVMLSDILPTGFECGVLNGKVEPGSSVVVIGAGPVGLAALLTAQLYSPSVVIVIDPDENRLAVARQFGAMETGTPAQAEELVSRVTEGQGCDAVIEAVGIPATFAQCQSLVAPGGVIANVGVHGVKADLHLEKLWDRNIGEFACFLNQRVVER